MSSLRIDRIAIDARAVSAVFDSVTALSESSFSIPRGSITAVIGPNGAGKSTVLNLIAGVVEPNTGSVEVMGHAPGGSRVAYVLQSTRVSESLPISVREVVAMGRYSRLGLYRWFTDADQEAIDDAISRMGIGDIQERHIHELSGGQRQRVFVAQGLAQDHELLLLDEPLTGLDITSAQAIDDVIHEEHASGCTIVMTTHDLAEAQVADFVLLLSGSVVASGTPEEVLTSENLATAYGPNLLHVQGRRLFIDDPAHTPVGGRHVHRERPARD